MRTFLSLAVLLMSITASAQNAAPSWLESTLYGSGKINAVVAVVAALSVAVTFVTPWN